MKLAIIVLAALNVALLGAWAGLFGPVAGDSPDPQRLAQQVRPEQLRVVGPGPGEAAAGAGAAAASATGPGSTVPPSPPAPSGSGSTAGAASQASPPGAPDAALPAGGASASSGAQACIEWGPFSEAELPRVQVLLAQAMPGAAVEAVRRDTERRSFIVHLPPLPDLPAAQARAAELRAAGFDAYVLRDGPLRFGISLGLFRQEDSALALQRDLARRGLDGAQVAARGGDRSVVRATGAALAAAPRAALAGQFPDRALRDCTG